MAMVKFGHRRTIEECQPVKLRERIRDAVVAPVNFANPVHWRYSNLKFELQPNFTQDTIDL